MVQPLRLHLLGVEALEGRRGPEDLELFLLMDHAPVGDLVYGLPTVNGSLRKRNGFLKNVRKLAASFSQALLTLTMIF